MFMINHGQKGLRIILGVKMKTPKWSDISEGRNVLFMPFFTASAMLDCFESDIR